MNKNYNWRLPLVLWAVLGTLTLLGIIALGRYDGLYGQDAFAYYTYAIGPLNATMPSFPAPFFWPPGYPLLVWLATEVMGSTPLAGQLVSMSGGLLVAIFTFLLARTTASEFKQAEQIAVVAGLLVACTGQLWQSSIVVMADSTGLACATIGIWALIRFDQHLEKTAFSNASQQLPFQPAYRTVTWLLLAAGFLAYAILSRWGYALVAIPATFYACYLLIRLYRCYQSNRIQRALLVTILIPICSAGCIVVLVLSPIFIAYLNGIIEPYTQHIAFWGDFNVYSSWNLLTAFRRQFVTNDGLLSYQLPNGLYYATAPARLAYFTPLLAWLLIPGLWSWWQQRKNFSAFHQRVTILLFSWALIVYLYHAGEPYQNFRFTLAFLPPLAIFVASGFVAINQRLAARFRTAWLCFLVAGLLVMGWGGSRRIVNLIESKNQNLAIVAWVEAQTPAPGRLFTFSMTATFQYYSHLETLELFSLTPQLIDEQLSIHIPTYLLVDQANIEQQWAGRSPQINFHWLQENRTLVELAQRDAYTLFRIEP